MLPAHHSPVDGTLSSPASSVVAELLAMTPLLIARNVRQAARLLEAEMDVNVEVIHSDPEAAELSSARGFELEIVRDEVRPVVVLRAALSYALHSDDASMHRLHASWKAVREAMFSRLGTQDVDNLGKDGHDGLEWSADEGRLRLILVSSDQLGTSCLMVMIFPILHDEVRFAPVPALADLEP